VLKQAEDNKKKYKAPGIRKTTRRNVHIKQTLRPEAFDVFQLAFSPPPQ
jgi:hypothetical protein